MTALAKYDDGFSREQIETLKGVICPGITDAELLLVQEVCRQTGLSPFTKQIHVTRRLTWNPDTRTKEPKLTIQTGIDGYRLTAERTGLYDGQDAAEWCDAKGLWREVWLTNDYPSAARVKVYKKGISRAFVGVARWEAYKQVGKDGLNSMWLKMGAEQLAKCAEALALRKAFPQELSHVYTKEEMDQADNEVREPARVLPMKPRQEMPMHEPQEPAEVPPAAASKADAAVNPPADDKGPRFTAKYPVKELAGTYMQDADVDDLVEYIDYYKERALGLEKEMDEQRKEGGEDRGTRKHYDAVVLTLANAKNALAPMLGLKMEPEDE